MSLILRIVLSKIFKTISITSSNKKRIKINIEKTHNSSMCFGKKATYVIGT